MVVAVGISHPGVKPTCVIDVRPVKGISNRVVEPSVRPVIHQAESEGRSGKEAVERIIYIMPVIDVDKASETVKEPSVVIVHIQAAYTSEPTVVVPDIDPSDSGDPTVVVIENRYVLDLYDRTVIVILYKRAVVKSRIEGDVSPTEIEVSTNVYPVVNVKIELTIRIHGKCNSVLHEDYRIIKTEYTVDSGIVFQS